MQTGSTPPPIFGTGASGHAPEDQSGGFESPFANPPPGYRHMSEPTITADIPRPPGPGRSRWVAPVALIAAGVIGAGVFGALSVKKASDDAAAVRVERDRAIGERDQLRTDLDQAVSRVETADKTIEELSNQLADVEKSANEQQEAIAKKAEKAAAFEKKIRELAGSVDAKVVRDGKRLVLVLDDGDLFGRGEAELSRKGKRSLRKIGAAIKKSEKQIRVGGHADEIKGGRAKSKFDSNWALSAARAISVVQYLEDKSGIPGSRLAAVAYAKHHPAKGLKRGRVEITLE